MDIEDFNKMIGEKVWKCRLELGIARTAVAEKIGVSHQQFEKYEKGTNRISVGTLAAIMEYFNVTPEYFFNDIAPADYSETQRRLCREISHNFLKIKNPKHVKLMLTTAKILADG